MSAASEKRKKKSQERKLKALKKRVHAKVLKYQKRMEKIRRKAEIRALQYANIEEQLKSADKPRVGDPVLPDVSVSADAARVSPESAVAGRSKRKEKKEEEARAKAERKRIHSGNLTMYERFEVTPFEDLEALLMNAPTRDERIFYRTVLNLKLQIEQEKVIGEVLL